jgi:hypothetical protein
MTKDETTSPTVMNENVFITACIDAHEERDVATVDVPGAFLHTHVDPEDDTVHMILQGVLAELMVKVDPKLYRKYVIYDSKGRMILYVEMQKALYGMLKSALLFYKKLVGDLEGAGFKLNPYDPCVANKIVNGTQMTVIWHVDDLKISHKNPEAVTKVIKYLDGIYPGVKVKRGKHHEYLGMDFDFATKGQVAVGMTDYMMRVIKEFPEDLGNATAPTPAQEFLFKVRPEDEAKKLPEKQAAQYHHVVAQLLFASTRVRRDIQTAVAFLTTRVKAPDEDDWGKLKRVLKYIKGTIGLRLILKASSLSVIKWWVDAAFAIHHDCRGHTGAMMSFGEGAVISKSLKQKMNGKSSTDNELIGADELIGPIMQTLYFMRAQGYHVEENILNQDNHSTMRLMFNGRASSKRTRHLDVKIFHMKDIIDRGELSVKYCPTEEMWADVLTKPLQGKAFRVMRSKLMNCAEDYVEECTKRVWFQEIAGVSAETGAAKTTGVGLKVIPEKYPRSLRKVAKPNNTTRGRKTKESSTSVRRSVLGNTHLARATRARTNIRVGTRTGHYR